MATYVSLVQTAERDVQNAQELASIWGEIRTEIADHEGELLASYAVLGEWDFLVVFDAPDREGAFKAALTLRRHDLSAQTMPATDTDAFAHLVDEI